MGMKNLTGHFSTKQTPQSQPIPGREKDMAKNHAGGFSFTIDKWSQLDRFLILGTEGGTYYCSEQKHTLENAKCLMACIQEDAKRTVDAIVAVSDAGRAMKNTPALFALAAVCKMAPTAEGKTYAYSALPKVARIGTHLFNWTEAIKAFGGFTSGYKRAVARWYVDRVNHEALDRVQADESLSDDEKAEAVARILAAGPRSAALQVVKYQSRDGWSHGDLLRLAKPGMYKGTAIERGSELDRVLGWATGKWSPNLDAGAPGDATDLIWAFEKAKQIGLQGDANGPRVRAIVGLITEHRLPREGIPTHFLNSPPVWEALLDNGGRGMPMTAMIRNLPKMTSIGLLRTGNAATRHITAALKDEDRLRGARIHPLQVLVAMRTYAQGRGIRGSLTWSPVSSIVDALDNAFYKTFQTVEPTGKRWLLGLDVSGSMGAGIAGLPGVNCREAAAAMAMVTAAAEGECHVMGFTSGNGGYYGGRAPNYKVVKGYRNRGGYYGGSGDTGVSVLDLSPRRRLDDNVRTITGLPFGATDCALPMIYALQEGIEVDVFSVYTDNETWAGVIQPVQALKQYRQKTGIDAKLIVVGMTATGFSIADPKDRGMLDVVGMDTGAPRVMAEFAKGNI